MCEFLSAVKALDKNGKEKWYFLTYHLIHETPRGEMLQKKFPGSDELIGHSAIREYFGLRSGQGENWECSDFSTPKNFPTVIVKAIKRGEFKGFVPPSGLLTAPAEKSYDEAIAPAEKAYDEAIAPAEKANEEAIATAEKAYQEARATAEKAYEEAIAPAEKAYDEARATAGKSYEEAIAPAEKAYDEARATAEKAYEEAIAPAEKAYQEARATAFWDLFALPENRTEVWR